MSSRVAPVALASGSSPPEGSAPRGRRLFRDLTALTLLFFGSIPSAARDSAADYYRVEVGRATLNIRAAPTTEADVLVRWTTGTIVRNLGCREEPDRVWCAVERPVRDGVRGWAAQDYLRQTRPPERARWAGEAIVAATAPHANRQVTCALAPDAPMIACEFGVVRGGSGNAIVVVRRPDGEQRTIEFEEGVPVASDAGLISVRRSGAVTELAIGAFERYAVPDAVVLDLESNG